MSGRVRVLMALALLSGSCALAYEILYMRALTTLLGDMLYVHAALLATFLVGIGLGAKLAHRWFRHLWIFEVLTGVWAVSMPLLSGWLSAQPLMARITASPSLTIAATIGFLVIPSLLIGFSIPLFSAYIKADEVGRLAFQSVYIAYNLGALISVLGVEFLLVRYLGVSTSLAVIGAINVLNGIVLVAMRGAPATLAGPAPRRFSRRIVLSLALISLSSAVFQMLFLKLTYLVFAPHRENFAIGLAVTMLGIFLGAWLASRRPISYDSLLILIAIALGLTFSAYYPILRLSQVTESWFSSEAGILAHKFVVGGLFALGPMILYGATLPSLMRTEKEVAGESGHLLWVSSMANAAGYLVYVMLAHPLLPTGVLIVLLAAAALMASLIATGARWSRPQITLAGVAVALGVLLVALWQEPRFYLAQWAESLDDDDRVTVFKSGAESATMLEDPDYVWVSYNGHPSIYVHTNGVISLSEMVSGTIPALTAPRLDRALVLGLGTGITAGATASIFSETDVVEINDAFYEMMPHLAYANMAIGENPAANRFLSDGRAFLVGKRNVYDAIVNSIPAPTYYSASKIYTLEFYERVVEALAPDGVFCTWLAVPNMSAEGLQVVLSALRKNFRYCDLRLLNSAYYMATCSASPIVSRQFRELPIELKLVDQLKQAVPRFRLNEFFEDIRLSDNLFERYTPNVPRENTDDHPILEFMVVRNLQTGQTGDDPILEQQELMNVDPVRRAELAKPARFVRRAAVYRWLDDRFYERNFEPLLDGDPELKQAWRSWRD